MKLIGVVICRFDAQLPHVLPLELGDLLEIAQQNGEWYLGSNVRDATAKQGIFPACYVRVQPTSNGHRSSFYDDAVVEEVASVLREWGVIWKQMYMKRECCQWTALGKNMCDLIDWRRQLMTGTCTQDHLRDLRLRITSHIDWGNRKLGLDLVPRVEERIVQPDTLGVYELYNVHVASVERNQNETLRQSSRPKTANQKQQQGQQHLYFSMRHFGYPLSEDVEVYFSIYDMQTSKLIGEKFLVKVLREGFSSYVDKLNDNATLFTELERDDLKKDLYLIVQVVRVGRLIYTESSKRALCQSYRRPHAVAVLRLAEALHNHYQLDDEHEFALKLYQCDEKEYGMWHELVAKKMSSKFSLLSGPTSCAVVVSLGLLCGDISSLRKEYLHLLKNVPLTKKLGFPDVIMPGDVRNDLYLVMEKADFERGGKSNGKKIQVTIVVLDNNGRLIEKCLLGASNSEGFTVHESIVLYHTNSPSWCEMVKVSLPIEEYYRAHVRFEYRHCSTKDKTEKRLLGFSFTPLMDQDGTVLPDGQHQLLVYKCEDANRLRDVALYLNLPYSSRQVSSTIVSPSGQSQRNTRESVTVSLHLCSTKLTQMPICFRC